MKGKTPKFLDSPYLAGEPGNWHLKDGAPEEIVKEFTEYMNHQSLLHETPRSIELDEIEIDSLKKKD